MPTAKPETVSAYLAKLPADRRKELQRVRAVVRKHLPEGYQESMGFGMIVYQVPLKVYPDTYNGQPLCYAGLANQKNHLSLYLMCAYGSPPLARKLRQGFAAAGKKLDMGKSCIRFKTADDLALDAVAEVVASVPADEFVAHARAARRR
jgi:hypothetical protein